MAADRFFLGRDSWLPSGISDIRDLLNSFAGSISQLKRDLSNEELKKEVCLASRSASIEFAAICEMERYFNTELAERLRSCLTESLELLHGCDYRQAIEDRLKELQELENLDFAVDEFNSSIESRSY